MQTTRARRPLLALLVGSLLGSLLIAGGAVALLLARLSAPAGSGAAAPIAPAPRFALTDQLGRPVSDADLRGKVVVDGFMLGVEVLEAAAQDAAAHEAAAAHSLGDGHAGGHGAGHGGDYEVSHSGHLVVIDRDWQIRSYHDSSELDQDAPMRQLQALASGS